jgi:hypothetical protein
MGPANIFLGEGTPCKKWLISTLYKGIYFKGTNFQGSIYKTSLHKIGWRSAEKNYPFISSMLLLA